MPGKTSWVAKKNYSVLLCVPWCTSNLFCRVKFCLFPGSGASLETLNFDGEFWYQMQDNLVWNIHMKVLILVSAADPSWILQSHLKFVWINLHVRYCEYHWVGNLQSHTKKEMNKIKMSYSLNDRSSSKVWNPDSYPWLGWEHPEQWPSPSGRWHGSQVISFILNIFTVQYLND